MVIERELLLIKGQYFNVDIDNLMPYNVLPSTSNKSFDAIRSPMCLLHDMSLLLILLMQLYTIFISNTINILFLRICLWSF